MDTILTSIIVGIPLAVVFFGLRHEWKKREDRNIEAIIKARYSAEKLIEELEPTVKRQGEDILETRTLVAAIEKLHADLLLELNLRVTALEVKAKEDDPNFRRGDEPEPEPVPLVNLNERPNLATNLKGWV